MASDNILVGQSSQWKTHHKRICKLYNQFTTSNAYQALAIHEKLDSLLLSHLLMQTLPTGVLPATDNVLSPISIFLSLLPGQDQSVSGPPVLYQTTPTLQGFINSLYSRFGNNNFSMHSHLTTFGHGIFPLASRLFNHACVPNAAAKYKLSRSEPVTMEVVALRDIVEGEEVRTSHVTCMPGSYSLTRLDLFAISGSCSPPNSPTDFRDHVWVQMHMSLLSMPEFGGSCSKATRRLNRTSCD